MQNYVRQFSKIRVVFALRFTSETKSVTPTYLYEVDKILKYIRKN